MLSRRRLIEYAGLAFAGQAVAHRTAAAQQASLPDSLSLQSLRPPPADARPAIDEAVRRLRSGGVISFPAGETRLGGPVTVRGQRIRLAGQGANASTIRFDAEGSAIRMGDGSKGGIYQSEITGLGFVASSPGTRTAIELENVSSMKLEDIGIATGNWRGPRAIGIRLRGRDSTTLRNVRIACARPLVLSPNPLHPMLAVDHLRVSECEFVGTEPTAPVIEFEPGVPMSTTVIEKTAIVQGSDGVRWRDSKAKGASFGLAFRDVRVEQGLSPDGWSFDLQSEVMQFQTVLFDNVRLDNRRNGIRIRGGQRITLINVQLDTRAANPRVLLDIVGVPGTSLILINCFGQIGGRLKLSKLRKVKDVPPTIFGEPLGPLEMWVYDPAVP